MNVTITRNAENNITSIIYFFPTDQIHDTTFYSYELLSDTIFIKTIDHQPGYAHVNLDYKFTRDFHLISSYQYVDPSFGGYVKERVSCFYENKERISKLQKVEEPSLRQNELKFFYSSEITENKEDALCKLLVGKDYYLPDIEWFYPFKFHLDENVEPNSISSTNPFQITRITANHPGLGLEDQEEATINYEMNKDNLLSKATFFIKGRDEHQLQGIIRKFTY